MSTTVTVRPSAVLATSNSSLTGAGSYNAAESDNSDSSYLSLPITSGVGSSVQLDFADPSIPGGAVITAVTPRVRINLNDALAAENYFRAVVRTGSSSFGDESFALYLLGGVSGWGTFSGGRRITQPDGSVWTQAAVNSLNMEVKRLVGGTAAGNLLVAEMYLDVEYNYTPTATGTSPNTTVNTSRPTFGWSYSDTDADPQIAYRVRVFSSVQYTAAGFDPNTTTPYADSGVVNSAGTTWTCNADLQNGLAYRAFIAVIDGISNTWSTITSAGPYASATFISDPTAGPDISATSVDQTNKRVSLTLQDRQNLMVGEEGDFEASIGSWVSDNNAILVQSGTYAYSGTKSLRMTANVDSTGSYTSAKSSNTLALNPGGTYSAAASIFKPSGTARKVKIAIYWYNSSNVFLTSSDGIDVTQVVNSWTPVFVKATAPANTSYGKIVVFGYDMTAGEQQYIDGVTIVPGPMNQLDDPIFEYDDGSGTAGVATNWSSYLFGTGTVAYSLDTTPANVVAGNQSQKIVQSSISGGGTAGISSKRTIPVKNGTAYTISAWVKANAATTAIRLSHSGLNSGTAQYFTLAANTWTRITWTVTANSTTSAANLILACDTTAITWWIGHIQFELGSSASAELYNLKYFTRTGLQTAQRFEVQRSINGGTSWTDITNRLLSDPTGALSFTVLTGIDVSDLTQLITVYDYDAPLSASLKYRVRSKAVVSGSTFTSGWSYWQTLTAPTYDPLYWWMKVPELPSLNYKFGFKGPDWNRKSAEAGAFFNPITRNRKVKVRDVIYGDEFTLTLSAISQAEVDAFTLIRNAQRTVLLQATDGRQWFCDFDNEVNFHEIVTDPTQPFQEIAIPFVEVDAPYI